jgi:hypothetical protein
MRKVIPLCLIGLLAGSPPAHAQAMPLKGTIVSVSITPTNDLVPTSIYTIPAKGHFVLTQIGVSASPTGSNSSLFAVTGWGSLGEPPLNSPFTYNPGLALPPSAAIQCTGSSGPGDCYITGVLEK